MEIIVSRLIEAFYGVPACLPSFVFDSFREEGEMSLDRIAEQIEEITLLPHLQVGPTFGVYLGMDSLISFVPKIS